MDCLLFFVFDDEFAVYLAASYGENAKGRQQKHSLDIFIDLGATFGYFKL